MELRLALGLQRVGGNQHSELIWLLRPQGSGMHVQEHCLQFLGCWTLVNWPCLEWEGAWSLPRMPQGQQPRSRCKKGEVCPDSGKTCPSFSCPQEQQKQQEKLSHHPGGLTPISALSSGRAVLPLLCLGKWQNPSFYFIPVSWLVAAHF